MQIYDISQDILSAPVFPGDPVPKMRRIQEISKGNTCNLSEISMCLHNATHIDAPNHFVEGAATIEQLELETFIGECEVISMFDNEITGEDIDSHVKDNVERLIIKGHGSCRLTKSGALALINSNIKLVGIDNQAIGVNGQEADVHLILQRSGIVILEGLALAGVPSGQYLLIAPPIKISGAEGAPCRAVLLHD